MVSQVAMRRYVGNLCACFYQNLSYSMMQDQFKFYSTQKDSIKRLLNLHDVEEAKGEMLKKPTWKVLVYDNFGQNVISPLFTLSELREHGVTLHLQLHSHRDPVPETPAIYFVHPTKENLTRISEDLNAQLYEKYYLSFISPVSRDELERLAHLAVENSSHVFLTKIYDEYLNFISLHEDLFVSRSSEDKLVSFQNIHRNDVTAEEMSTLVSSVVDSLFSVLLTVGVIPTIKCFKAGPSELVAQELHKRIQDHLFDAKFGSSLNPRVGSQRCLLLIYDRSNDLVAPLLHSWAYLPLVDDIFNIKLNRVALASKGNKPVTYDLYNFDKFLQNHRFRPFPDVAGNIQLEIDDFKKKESSIKKLANNDLQEDIREDVWCSETNRLTSAVNSLPELFQRKKFLEMHTNIASEAMERVKNRKLDAIYQTEKGLIAKTSQNSAELLSLLESDDVSPDDKLRLFLVAHICDGFNSQDDFVKARNSLPDDPSTAAIKFVSQHKTVAKIASHTHNSSSVSGPRNSYSSVLSRIVSKSPQYLLEGVKSLVSGETLLPLTRIVQSMIEGKTANGELLTFQSGSQPNIKQTASFRDVIVYVVGGGCYTEYMDVVSLLKDRTDMDVKNIVYGCTEIMNPVYFLRQLNELGNN